MLPRVKALVLVSDYLKLSLPLFELRECIWIIWLEACMSWDSSAGISVMTTDDILFLSEMGKAGTWNRPAPWHGRGSNIQNVSRCSKFPSFGHHPLPQFSIWEMGGIQWNHCVTKTASTRFLWVRYCAEYVSSSYPNNSPTKWYH